MTRHILLTAAILVAGLPLHVSAQDVEMLGRRYGKLPPAAYYQEMARNPDAFRFQRGRAGRMRAAAALRSSARATPGPAGVGPGGPAAVGLGPRTEPVVGNFFVPVVLGLFSDSPTTPPVSAATIQTGYFGPQTGTVSEFYAEVSNDSIALFGSVQGWVTSSMTQAQVTQGISALGCCGIGDFIKSLLSDPQNAGIDWGAFDNDGPDGVPNSGDDDGYVDALAVIHPTPGAECTGTWPNRIWSHKWSLTDASTSHTPYLTNTAASGGGFILVDDYFVQAAVKCSGVGLNDIGVFTHETGHAFGLPDLYDTRSVGGHEGAGQWDLMAGGTYGCSGTAPYSPCHMSAWSKAALGWVTVDTLPPDTDFGTLMLPPVETTGLVYRIDAADGSDEYFLLENRQSGLASTTFDQLLPGEGLLIWQIDAGVVDARWLTNTVNSADHMGVWLRQADGLDELGSPFGDRGDAGDPFPGSTGNTAFNAATNPAARSYQGTAVGLSLLDVSAPAVSNDVTFRLITGFTAMADQAVDMVATLPTNVQLSAQSGTPPFSWRLVFGALPSGITLQTDGLLLGRTAALGSFGVTVEVTDAVGLTGRALVTLDVAAPSFTIAQLSDAFLLGDQPLDSIQGAFLDQQGNANGTYDLGDFRKWVLANPGLPLSAGLPPAPVPSGPRVLVLPVALQAPERKP